MSTTLARIRALRAAHAVTLGGMFALPACGDPASADAGTDAAHTDDSGDASADASADVSADTGLPDADLPDATTDAPIGDAPDPSDTDRDTAPPDAASDAPDDVASDATGDAAADLGDPDAGDTVDVTDPDVTDPDVTDPDVTDPDVTDPDTGETPCKEFEDNVCDPSCTRDNDFDCCLDGALPGEFCSFDASFGCLCAIEGPFAPPSLALSLTIPAGLR